MNKVSDKALAEVNAAFEVYKEEVRASDLSKNTKEVYLGDVALFVKWLAGEYEPGERVSQPASLEGWCLSHDGDDCGQEQG